MARNKKKDTSSAKSSGKKGARNQPEKNYAGFFKKHGVFIAVSIGIIIILAIYLAVTTQPAPGQNSESAAQVCANRTITFVNDNLVESGSAASLVSIDELRGMYQINVSYQSKPVSVYTTKDCTLFLINPYTLDTAAPAPDRSPVTSPAVCANRTISYVNDNLVQPNTSASFLSIGETKGLYVINTSYQSKTVPVYTTKDCVLLFMNPLPLETAAPVPSVT